MAKKKSTPRTNPRPFRVVTTADTVDLEGNPIPSGSTVNRIIWDGVTSYDPGIGLKLIED